MRIKEKLSQWKRLLAAGISGTQKAMDTEKSSRGSHRKRSEIDVQEYGTGFHEADLHRIELNESPAAFSTEDFCADDR